MTIAFTYSLSAHAAFDFSCTAVDLDSETNSSTFKFKIEAKGGDTTLTIGVAQQPNDQLTFITDPQETVMERFTLDQIKSNDAFNESMKQAGVAIDNVDTAIRFGAMTNGWSWFMVLYFKNKVLVGKSAYAMGRMDASYSCQK